ncbi:O-antigen ligase family protein [uncultured Ilyobacter sp.]|uniref:O-antigen ligase family protein n=1 Tax=uncultured Ilyobacter sp. TaxID=544433 RepID=UPI0029C0082D|nr:O-antigen ligase family protein [uncultured Ilyobacter sp.]
MKKKIEIALLGLLLTFLPFLVRLKILPTKPGTLMYLTHPLGEAIGDMFHYEKSRVLVFLGISMILILILKRNLKKTYYYAGLIIYGIGVLLSTFFSPFLPIALSGGGNRYEGVFVLLSYVVVSFFVINFVRERKDLKHFIYILLLGSFFVSLAGITEFMGMSIYKIPFLAKFAIPQEGLLDKVTYPEGYISMAQVIKFSPKFHNVKASLGNSNYSGSYGVMICMFLFPLILKSKDKFTRYIFMFFYAVNLALLLAGRSRAGIYATIASFIIFTVLCRKEIWKRKIFLLEIPLITGAVLLALNILSSGAVGDNIENLEVNKKVNLREIRSIENTLEVSSYDNKLVLKSGKEELSFYREDGTLIPGNIEENIITLGDPEFQKYSFENKENGVLELQYDEIEFPLVIQNQKFKTIGWSRKPEEIVSPERIENWDRYQKKASKRVYIWSRSLPLLKKSGFFGFGPDTYPIIFPQNDYFGKTISWNNPYMFVSKPHNLYLQIGINTGWISLFGFLLLVICYCLDSLRIYFSSSYEDIYEIVGVACSLAVMGYLMAGMFNDSAVSVAPTFWAILGLGISMNIKIRKGII